MGRWNEGAALCHYGVLGMRWGVRKDPYYVSNITMNRMIKCGKYDLKKEKNKCKGIQEAWEQKTGKQSCQIRSKGKKMG